MLCIVQSILLIGGYCYGFFLITSHDAHAPDFGSAKLPWQSIMFFPRACGERMCCKYSNAMCDGKSEALVWLMCAFAAWLLDSAGSGRNDRRSSKDHTRDHFPVSSCNTLISSALLLSLSSSCRVDTSAAARDPRGPVIAALIGWR